MSSMPSRVRDVCEEFSGEFAETDWPRVQVLAFAAMLCLGRHPVCRPLRIAGALAEGHGSSFHRMLSRRRWSLGRLARRLAQQVLEQLVPRGVVSLSGDDAVTSHPGKKVSGKGKPRDAVRSTHSFTAWK